MKLDLWREIDPWRELERGMEYSGDVQLAKFDRLASLLAEDEGQVNYLIQFGRDEVRRPFIDLKVDAIYSLTCQRSLEVFSYPVEISTRLGVVESEGMVDSLPEDWEPVVVADGYFRLSDIIEEELILAVPLVAVNQDASQVAYSNPEMPEQAKEDKVNPFAVLKNLKPN